VTGEGLPKERNLLMAIDQAREANGAVHEAIFRVNPQFPREYLW
jgi:hypothetical protein